MNDVTQMNILTFAGQIITGLVMLIGLIVVAIKARGQGRVLGALGLGLGLLRVIVGALQPFLIRGGDPSGLVDRIYIFNFVGTLLSLVSLGLMIAGIASRQRETTPPAPGWPQPVGAVPGGPQPVQQLAGPRPLPPQPGGPMPQPSLAPQGMPQRGGAPAFPQHPQQVLGAPSPGPQQPPAPRP